MHGGRLAGEFMPPLAAGGVGRISTPRSSRQAAEQVGLRPKAVLAEWRYSPLPLRQASRAAGMNRAARFMEALRRLKLPQKSFLVADKHAML